MREEVQKCLELLEAAVMERCREKTVGLVFSAGIDSTLIGMLASRHCDIEAYAVGLSGSTDLEHARGMTDEVPFGIHAIEVSENGLEGDLPLIIEAAGSARPLDVGVAIPFYYSSRTASADGIRTMLCGQGGDELFGGYNRYLELLGKGGYAGLEELMRRDLRELPKSNLERDIRVCRANGVTLEVPFLDKNFMEYVSGIPTELKIKEVPASRKLEYDCVDQLNGKRFIRKYIEREIAHQAGVPEEAIQRVKKAAQYGSGSQKTLEKLARKNGFRKKASEAGRQDYTAMYLESLLK
jgi:asparagine synthase (glutamine-hydrolysing)